MPKILDNDAGEVVEIIVTRILTETPKAYNVEIPIKVGADGVLKKWEAWLPKSQIDMRDGNGGKKIFILPKWLFIRMQVDISEYYSEFKIARPKEK